MRVMDGISLFYGKAFDCNTYVLGGKILVDPGVERPVRDFLAELNGDGITPDKIDAILCTHCHCDHIGILAEIQKETQAEVWAHPLDADAISSGDSRRTLGFGLQPVEVTRLLKEGDDVGGFKVLHTPGHTPGSICLFDGKRGVLLSGDTVFADGIGRTDLAGGSTPDMRNSLQRLSLLEVVALLPGHGPVLKENAKASIGAGLTMVDSL